MKYPINEIFETIQGEARYTGTPALFVRLQGCDVGCPWCDTKHTWLVETESNKDDIIAKTTDSNTHAMFTADALADVLSAYTATHVVITGGEPCTYNLMELTTALIDKQYTVQLETSGTYNIAVHGDVWVTVSPKINMPGGKVVLEQALARADEIKHPVGKLSDVTLLTSLLNANKHNIKPNLKVWLQPLSQSKKATSVCVKAATSHGFNVSIQTHKYLGVR